MPFLEVKPVGERTSQPLLLQSTSVDSQLTNEYEVSKEKKRACEPRASLPAAESKSVNSQHMNEVLTDGKPARSPNSSPRSSKPIASEAMNDAATNEHVTRQSCLKSTSNSQVIDYGSLSEVARGKLPAQRPNPSSQNSKSNFSDIPSVCDTVKQDESTSQRHFSDQPSTSVMDFSGKSPGLEAPCDRQLPNLMDIARRYGTQALPYRHLFDTDQYWDKIKAIQSRRSTRGMVRYHVDYVAMTQVG